MQLRLARAGRAICLAATIALAGCGSAVLGSPSGPSGTTDSGPIVDGVPPTSVPFVKRAPADFTERAEHIASALRASGALDSYARDLVLTSPRIEWADLGGSGDLKLLLGNGGYEAGPAVTDDTGRGMIQFLDGRAEEVTLQGARSALEATKRDLPGCSSVGDTPCPLVLTSAKLGTMRVSTNQGPADVPAWHFMGNGLRSPHIVVAVDPTALHDLPKPVYDAPSWPKAVLGAGSLLSTQGAAVTVALEFGGCGRDWAAHVYEAQDIVVVGGSMRPLNVDCLDVGHSGTAMLLLRTPLGTRPIVDVAWGRVLTLPQPPQS